MELTFGMGFDCGYFWGIKWICSNWVKTDRNI